VAALLVTPLAFVTVILALAKGEPLAVRTVPAIRPSCACDETGTASAGHR